MRGFMELPRHLAEAAPGMQSALSTDSADQTLRRTRPSQTSAHTYLHYRHLEGEQRPLPWLPGARHRPAGEHHLPSSAYSRTLMIPPRRPASFQDNLWDDLRSFNLLACGTGSARTTCSRVRPIATTQQNGPYHASSSLRGPENASCPRYHLTEMSVGSSRSAAARPRSFHRMPASSLAHVSHILEIGSCFLMKLLQK